VPNFIGVRVNNAADIWSAAGFTGTLVAGDFPNGNYVITTQSLPASSSQACTASIEVGGL
jgi:hypothetical protein